MMPIEQGYWNDWQTHLQIFDFAVVNVTRGVVVELVGNKNALGLVLVLAILTPI